MGSQRLQPKLTNHLELYTVYRLWNKHTLVYFVQVKQNSPSEEVDSVAVYEEVIASLSRQIEELSCTVDLLKQGEQTLKLSLRLADQKTLEADSKLRHALER